MELFYNKSLMKTFFKMKIFNKFIWSKKEPSNKNDIWFDGSTVRLYKEGEWYTVTLSKEAIERLLQYAENVDIFKYVNELPEIGDPTFIYFKKEESSGNLIVLPYVYDGEWKQITNTEVFSESSPFGFGNANNSAVLKGLNNQVISEGGVALGAGNLVGLKGFYYKYITLKAGGQTRLANVYLSKTQVSNPTIDTNSGASFKDTSIKPQNYWAVGDIISIVNDAKYDDIATIKQVKDGLVQIEWLDGKSPFSTVKQESDLSSEDYSIYCLDKPTQGISDLGKYSFATGTDNKAINAYTEVSGKGNVVKGKFGKVWGKNNIGGYNTTTFGSGNVNLADNSLVNGTNNINEGNNSVIHGNKNKNYGKRAFVVGNENITNNENEAAFGKYNDSKNDTQFSIGIGTSDTDRKNAFEVKQNGDIYIEGVEGRIQDRLNINIDSALSDTSINPVQNKAIVAALATKTSEDDVNELIALEHVYFQYRADENKLYFRGFDDFKNWRLVLPYILNVTFGKPLTPHLSIATNDGATGISTNDFEIDLSMGRYKMTWSYNGKKFSLVFDESGSGEQIITSQDIDYATTQQLTELSAEVSGLSEKIDNLPTAESEVFKAVYGETTYNEIIEAHNEGKIVICEYDVWVCRLTKIQASQVMFQASADSSVTRLTCNTKGQWSVGTSSTFHNLKTLDNGNCEITIAARTAEVATPQYVETLLGTIINGDY